MHLNCMCIVRKRGIRTGRRRNSAPEVSGTPLEMKSNSEVPCKWCGVFGGTKQNPHDHLEFSRVEMKEFVQTNILCKPCVEIREEVHKLGQLLETLKKQLDALMEQIIQKKFRRLEEVNEDTEDEILPVGDEPAVEDDDQMENDSDSNPSLQSEETHENDSEITEEEEHLVKTRNRKKRRVSQVKNKILCKSQIRNRREYSCFYCDLRFPKKEEKFYHDESVHFSGSSIDVKGESLLYSRICGRSSFTPGDLQSHDLNFHSHHLKFLCLCCSPHKRFTSKELLSTHNEVHKDKISTFKCELCDKDNQLTFNVQSDLDNHIMRVHSYLLTPQKVVSEKEIQAECLGGPSGRGKKSVRCHFCGVAKAGGLFGMKEHERKTHLAEFTSTCLKGEGGCGTKYAEESHAQTCQLTHKTDLNGNWNCLVCKLTFNDRLNLKDHLEAKHTIGGIKCQLCSGEHSERFKCAYKLKLHQARIHRGEWPHKCSDCGKGFKSRQHLEDHVRNVHAEKNSVKPLECNVCKKQFSTTKRLLRHRKVEHEGMKGLLCPECGKMLMTDYSLKLHMKSHKGEKDQVCHFCSKTFVDPAVLKNHMRTHTGEKPYSCHICGKSWAQASPRKKHWELHRKNGTWVDDATSK